MEETIIKTEPQEQEAASELRSWVTPVFEKLALKDAQNGLVNNTDGFTVS